MNYFQEIKERVSCRNVCDMYGIPIRHGNFANCPFHTERTASLKLYPDGFHCYGCGKHGDVIDFVAELFHISASDAAEKINRDFYLGLSIRKPVGIGERLRADKAERERLAQRQKELTEYERLLSAYNKALSVWVQFDALVREISIRAKSGASRDDLPAIYKSALQNIETARYHLDCADASLREYELAHGR